MRAWLRTEVARLGALSLTRLHLTVAAIVGVVVTALLVAAVVLAAVFLTRGPKVATNPTPQQKVVQKAPVSPNTKAKDSLPCPPPPGQGVVGACTPKPVQVFGTSTGPKVTPATVDPPASIPDVSSWQGTVDWSAVKNWQVSNGFTPAGIFKMGEYVTDPYAAQNNAALRSLGMWRMGYWFIRNTGCSHEAQQIIDEARALGLSIVDLDDETPEAQGYDGCLTPTLKAAGLIVTEYASPGAYPGGAQSNNPAWIAAYGPLNPPGAPWGGPIVAFQCTDGVYGCVTYVPGIGRDDVSVNYGITKLGTPTVDQRSFNMGFKTGYATGTSIPAKRGFDITFHPRVGPKSSTDYNAGYRAGYSKGWHVDAANGKTSGANTPTRPTTYNGNFRLGYNNGWAIEVWQPFYNYWRLTKHVSNNATAFNTGYLKGKPAGYNSDFTWGYNYGASGI